MALFKKSNGQRILLSEEEEELIRTEWANNEAQAAANKWINERINEYPKIEDQLDMLWHELNIYGIIEKAGPWFKAIEAIKNKYPKAE